MDDGVRNGPAAPPIAPPVFGTEIYQHGSIGEFIGSSLEGVQSGFIRCVYAAKNHTGLTVTLLCEKMEGCCLNGCCPKDQWWMSALIILLIFVLVVFIVGMLLMIICYQRTKWQQRREEKEAQQRYATGTVGPSYEPGPYAREPVYNGTLQSNARRSQQPFQQMHNVSRF